jgi:peptidyl-prolyl cis-trans isomerase A (cyclophilin A)
MKQTQSRSLPPVVATLLLLAACTGPSDSQKAREEAKQPPPAAEKAAPPPAQSNVPEVFKVRFTTSKGPFVVEAHRGWAPIGVERFHELVKAGYYDGARFFRVLPNFVAQFGLAADPADSRKWDKPIKDDEVIRTNRAGSLAFATMGPNTRTTQVFINLRTNQSLDSQGFAPFAQVLEGMDVVEKLYSGYGEAPDQEAITKRGNKYLIENFPRLDYIKAATIIP